MFLLCELNECGKIIFFFPFYSVDVDGKLRQNTGNAFHLNQLTWILMILGNGCFVFAPPSIAIPSIGFVFLTVICKLPWLSGTTCGLCSWFGSFANPFGCSPDKRCIDCCSKQKQHQNQIKYKWKWNGDTNANAEFWAIPDAYANCRQVDFPIPLSYQNFLTVWWLIPVFIIRANACVCVRGCVQHETDFHKKIETENEIFEMISRFGFQTIINTMQHKLVKWFSVFD